MYERRLEIPGRQQRAQHGTADRGGGGAGHALAVVRQHTGHFVEGRALDPLHKDERLALARAIAVDVGKTTQVRHTAEVSVFLKERGGVCQMHGRFVCRARRGIGSQRTHERVVREHFDGESLV